MEEALQLLLIKDAICEEELKLLQGQLPIIIFIGAAENLERGGLESVLR